MGGLGRSFSTLFTVELSFLLLLCKVVSEGTFEWAHFSQLLSANKTNQHVFSPSLSIVVTSSLLCTCQARERRCFYDIRCVSAFFLFLNIGNKSINWRGEQWQLGLFTSCCSWKCGFGWTRLSSGSINHKERQQHTMLKKQWRILLFHFFFSFEALFTFYSSGRFHTELRMMMRLICPPTRSSSCCIFVSFSHGQRCTRATLIFLPSDSLRFIRGFSGSAQLGDLWTRRH